jgi:hypothetical protein
MSDKLKHALCLAADGFRVFPLEPDGKKPLIENWPERATTDEKQVLAWWQIWPEANIGVATGKGLVVLDADVKGGKPGLGSLVLIDLDHNLPETLRVRTPSGGVHVYLKTDPDLKVPNSVNSLRDYPGIDVRGDGGYVVGRGSTIGKGVYV